MENKIIYDPTTQRKPQLTFLCVVFQSYACSHDNT